MNYRELRIEYPGWEVSGFLYTSDDPRELGQDMLELRHPSGARINAGWYFEGDPDGTYEVELSQGRQRVGKVQSFADVDSAAHEVARLVANVEESIAIDRSKAAPSLR